VIDPIDPIDRTEQMRYILCMAHGRRGKRTVAVQLGLRFGSRRKPGEKRGGARRGAGRPRGDRRGAPHRARPAVSRHCPLHVTLRVREEAQSLRRAAVFRAVRPALRAARERLGFRLIQYSVQGNHVHLIVEADDRASLSRGVQSLATRLALAVNKARARRGRVFAERYHARSLKTPLEVRRALLYVLRNDRKHRSLTGWCLPPWHFDPCSSAREFDGWEDCELLALALAGHGPAPPMPLPSVAEPRSFLLRVGWRRHGLLRLDESPISHSSRARLITSAMLRPRSGQRTVTRHFSFE
jgi:REP element-mobilizing transposase RayT